jgi:hypothetical protein
MIRPGGLLLVILHLFAVPSFQFYGWGCKKEYITKLGCEKYDHRVTYSAPLEMLLPTHQEIMRQTLLSWISHGRANKKAPYAYLHEA